MALVFSPAARKALDAMPTADRERLRARLRAVAADPVGRHSGVTPLQGAPPGRLRAWQGDRRAVFKLDGGDVVVERVAHGREVYDR